MQGLFITATDTGAGKTHVAAAVCRALRREGRPFRVCKPVATGAERPMGAGWPTTRASWPRRPASATSTR